MGERLPAAAEDPGDKQSPVFPERGRTPLLHFPNAGMSRIDPQRSKRDYSRFRNKFEWIHTKMVRKRQVTASSYTENTGTTSGIFVLAIT